MVVCNTCGTQFDGRFCPNCGRAADAGTVPPPPPQYQTTSAGMTDNVAGALCYLLGFITGIIFLVIDPYKSNRAVRFHAFQSIFLSVGWIILTTVIGIVLPLAGYFIITPLLTLAVVAVWLFLMWKTYHNQKVVLPVVGELAQKQV